MSRMAWCVVVLAAAGGAFAQESDPTEAPEGKAYKYRERTEIVFGDEVEVQGELVRPSGALVNERPRVKFPPLIEPRTEWNDEVKSSVDAIH